MAIKHHPDVSTLMSCAAGSQPEGLAAVVASHLSVCPACAKQVNKLERIGDALFDRIEPVRVETPAPVAAARSLDAVDIVRRAPAVESGEVPAPLAAVIGPDLDALAWKRLGPGLWHYPLAMSPAAKGDLRLIKVAPGQSLPDHGHGGVEMTLVLRGSYTDPTGLYAAGDVADLADDIEHAPLADAVHGCICLIASEKPARFKGLFARMMQPLAGL
jgi:putative transcriptional regulator